MVQVKRFRFEMSKLFPQKLDSLMNMCQKKPFSISFMPIVWIDDFEEWQENVRN